MNTATWILIVGLALAALPAPAADARPIECVQNFDYPPVCCTYIGLFGDPIDPKNPTSGVKTTLERCDWLP